MDYRPRRRGGANTVGSLTEGQHSGSLLQPILACLNARKNRILLVAESSLPEPQFKAFRTLFLDEFGRNGLESELQAILDDHGSELDRNGQEQMTQERRCPHE